MHLSWFRFTCLECFGNAIHPRLGSILTVDEAARSCWGSRGLAGIMETNAQVAIQNSSTFYELRAKKIKATKLVAVLLAQRTDANSKFGAPKWKERLDAIFSYRTAKSTASHGAFGSLQPAPSRTGSHKFTRSRLELVALWQA